MLAVVCASEDHEHPVHIVGPVNTQEGGIVYINCRISIQDELQCCCSHIPPIMWL